MIERLAFGVLAATLIFGALRVVTCRNLVHTVLWLGLTLATTAVAFVMLHAPFLAAIQLILYTGGALTLMLFGVMLTRRVEGVIIPNEQSGQTRGAITAVALFGVMAGSIIKTDGLPHAAAIEVQTAALGRSFLTDHLLAFEVLSMLLLAAMVGAIVIARPKDPAPGEAPSQAPRGLREAKAKS